MKFLPLIVLSLTALSVSAQIKSTATTNTDGSRSANFSLELTKPSTTVTSQVNFEYPNGTTPEPLIRRRGSNNKNYILVANESTTDMSKFELDIFTGNKKFSRATLLIWLSATSADKEQLSNGTYHYSDKGPAERQKYEFSGTVTLGSSDVPVAGGWFNVSSSGKHIAVSYSLTLKNGVKTNGQYRTVYQNEDRRKSAAK
jgi:hypothetical protein